MFHKQMRLLFLVLFVFSLSSCANITTVDIGKDIKRLELTDPMITAYPRRAAFSHPETQWAMDTEAYKVCKNGFQIIKEQYLEDNGKGKDALVWDIKCQ
jgi:predicted small secreted protein